MFEEAITLDPKNSGAFSSLGWTYLMEIWFGLSESSEISMEKAAELAQKALALDDTLDFSHSLLANIYLMKRHYEKAIAEAKRAVVLNPNGADAHAHLGTTLHYAGERENAIPLLKKAIRLNPIPPNWYLFVLGEVYFMSGKYEEAISVYKKVLNRNSDDIRSLYGLAATYSLSGQEDKARASTEEVLRVSPTFSVEYFGMTLPFKNKADKELLIEALRNAGLPD
jgi:adenylate cyclase